MNKIAVIIFTLITFNSCSQKTKTNSFSKYAVDSTVLQHFKAAKAKSKYDLPMIADGFWFVIDKNDFSEFVGKQDPLHFLDTLQTFSEVVCDCMIKNDTIYLQGGMGYEGAIGFDLRVTSDLFNGRILLAGKEYKTSNSTNFTKEIFLDSRKQLLKLPSIDSLRTGKRFIGEFILESEDYYIKDDSAPKKLYMKVLFGCELDDTIVL